MHFSNKLIIQTELYSKIYNKNIKSVPVINSKMWQVMNIPVSVLSFLLMFKIWKEFK